MLLVNMHGDFKCKSKIESKGNLHRARAQYLLNHYTKIGS